jgi:hypothetical protein
VGRNCVKKRDSHKFFNPSDYTKMNSKIPDFNNFYSYIKEVSIDSVGNIFASSGWSAKCSAWGEWKLYNEWSDFILTTAGSKELLLNGAVIFDENNIDKIKKTFAIIEGAYACEFYDINKTLLLEFKSGE